MASFISSKLFDYVKEWTPKMKKMYQMLLMVVLFPAAQPGRCGGTPMHDPLSYARAFEILKAAKTQIEETKRVQEELAGTKRLIGNFKEEAQNLRGELLNWRTYYDKIDTLDANEFSAMSWLGLDRTIPARNAPEAFRLIDDKLFKTNSPEIKREDYTDTMNTLKYEREKLARKSIVTGIVVAEKSKSNLNESKKKIIMATDKSIGASDLISVMKTQNEILGVIASELVQSRELQAQMLEFMTAHSANMYGTGRNDPPKKETFKSSFQ